MGKCAIVKPSDTIELKRQSTTIGFPIVANHPIHLQLDCSISATR